MVPATAAGARSDWRLRRRGVGRVSTAAVLAPQRCILGTSQQWMVVKNFVTEAERQTLFSKAIRHLQRKELHPNPCGPRRFFAKVDDDPNRYVDGLLQTLTRRCERCLQLTGIEVDCVLGRTISLILPGGFIHAHTDAYRPGEAGHRPGFDHLRCNIVVSLADPSGRPVVEGSALPVSECDMWAFFASKCLHETLPLQGSDPRVVFGFGWSVPPEHVLRPPAPAAWDQLS